MTRVYSSYLADLLQFVQYTRENLSYLADLLKFLQYTIVHLSTFLSGYKMVLQLFDDRGLGNSFARGSCETLLTLCYMGFAKWKKVNKGVALLVPLCGAALYRTYPSLNAAAPRS